MRRIGVQVGTDFTPACIGTILLRRRTHAFSSTAFLILGALRPARTAVELRRLQILAGRLACSRISAPRQSSTALASPVDTQLTDGVTCVPAGSAVGFVALEQQARWPAAFVPTGRANTRAGNADFTDGASVAAASAVFPVSHGIEAANGWGSAPSEGRICAHTLGPSAYRVCRSGN